MSRFGQAGGFIKLRERFEAIMGFKKSDLCLSLTNEEKVCNEIIEKENEESKTDVMVASTGNMEVWEVLYII